MWCDFKERLSLVEGFPYKFILSIIKFLSINNRPAKQCPKNCIQWGEGVGGAVRETPSRDIARRHGQALYSSNSSHKQNHPSPQAQLSTPSTQRPKHTPPPTPLPQ